MLSNPVNMTIDHKFVSSDQFYTMNICAYFKVYGRMFQKKFNII